MTARDFRDRASEMLRSEDIIVVTRDDAPAGFYLPWDNPEVPVDVRREVLLRLSEQIGTQLAEQGTTCDVRSGGKADESCVRGWSLTQTHDRRTTTRQIRLCRALI